MPASGNTEWNAAQSLAAVPGGWLERLRGVIAGAPVATRSLLAQEALDAIAVAAGLKPAAAIGCGYRDDALAAAVGEAPAAAGLIINLRQGWAEPLGEAALPGWYASLVAEAAGKERILLLGAEARRAEWQQLTRENIGPGAVARGLGYPPCCVAEFHRRRGRYHLITVAMLARQAAGDEGLMRRLAAADVVPTPRGEAEWQDLLDATRTVFAPFTSVAMCDVCERGADGPARRMSADFARLASAVGFDAWLPAKA